MYDCHDEKDTVSGGGDFLFSKLTFIDHPLSNLIINFIYCGCMIIFICRSCLTMKWIVMMNGKRKNRERACLLQK